MHRTYVQQQKEAPSLPVIIQTLDYLDYFQWSHRDWIVEVWGILCSANVDVLSKNLHISVQQQVEV